MEDTMRGERKMEEKEEKTRNNTNKMRVKGKQWKKLKRKKERGYVN